MTHGNGQILLSVLSHAASLVGNRLQAEHGKAKLLALEAQLTSHVRLREIDAKVQEERLSLERHRVDVQASVVREIISAMIGGKLEALRTAYAEIAQGFAAQEAHFLSNHTRVTDAMTNANDATQRAIYGARLVDIESQLGDIRASRRRLFREMARAVVALHPQMSLAEVLSAEHTRYLQG